jgi:SAM-dependent methyltransferase
MYFKGKNTIQGSMTSDELEWLCETAREMDSVLEVGCWRGRSTDALLTGCKGPVYAVDHFQGSVGEVLIEIAKEEDIKASFLANVGHYRNLRLYDMPSVEAAKLFEDKSIDMIFIDGSHDRESVLADIKAWLPKAKKIFCGHDWGFDPVRAAIEEVKLPITRIIKNSMETALLDDWNRPIWAHIDSIWVHDIGGNG